MGLIEKLHIQKIWTRERIVCSACKETVIKYKVFGTDKTQYANCASILERIELVIHPHNCSVIE